MYLMYVSRRVVNIAANLIDVDLTFQSNGEKLFINFNKNFECCYEDITIYLITI